MPFLSSQAQKEDFQFLLQKLAQIHPNLYRFREQAELNDAFTRVQASLNQPRDLLNFYLLVSKAVAQIQCGHSKVSLPKDFREEFYQQAVLLPFTFHWIEGQIYIDADLRNEQKLPTGTHLLKIDGHPVDSLFESFLPYLSALSDAKSIQGKYRSLEQQFSFWYALTRPEATKPYLISYQDSRKITRQYRIEPISKADFYQRLELTRADAPLLHFTELSSLSTAILKINTFDQNRLQSQGLEFSNFLKKQFKYLKKNALDHLIIDLRGNTGGDDTHVLELLRYLLPKPFRAYREIRVSKHYRGYGRPVRQDSSYALLHHHPGLELQAPFSDRFGGEIYFLINGRTYSGAAELVAIAHAHGVGIFLGEETGGAYEGNNSGLLSTFTLPNSRLDIRIPRWSYYLNVDEPSHTQRGLMPDHSIGKNLEEIKEGIDGVMRYTIELIRQD